MQWIMLVVPLVLLLLGFPLFIILLGTSAILLLWFMNVPLALVPQTMFGSVDKFALLAVPFFLFVGEIMGVGGMSRRIVDWVLALIGGVRGARGLTTVGACTVFGAISGASVATIAAVGRLMYPSLKQRYGERFSSGMIASTGAIDILIPPSISMIIYGASAEQSVALLFLAGILPGLLMAGFQAGYIYYYALRYKVPDGGEPFQWARFLAATRSGFWAICAPVVILGGIYGGIFAPTEAAGIACVYGILVTKFIYREISWRQLWEVGINSMYLTAQIMVIVAAAGVFSWLLTVNGVAQAAVEFMQAMISSPWTALLLINVLLLIVGCVIDPTSAILVLTPLLVPICRAYGIDLIHFGIVMTMNLAIGMFTPPFGLNIFVTQAITRAPVGSIYPGLVPFIVITLLALAVVTYVPWLSLFLVKLV
jgi:C4-dicarboxylate transporter DctM subunit